MAMLDAILCPKWEGRYYSFNASWAPGEQMGSMRNGSGDDLFAHFTPAGCWLKGFAHEYPMSPYCNNPKRVWPGVLDTVPEQFVACLREPAFRIEDITFCIWRRHSDSNWQVGPISFPADYPDPDGSEYLLLNLDGRPESYQEWASDYYECDMPLGAVQHVYQHRPLTLQVLAQLNQDLSLADLEADISEIGYPT